MSNISDRLVEELKSKGMDINALGELGQVLEKVNHKYGQMQRHPDSAAIASVAKAGVDTVYVFTGLRQSSTSTKAQRKNTPKWVLMLIIFGIIAALSLALLYYVQFRQNERERLAQEGKALDAEIYETKRAISYVEALQRTGNAAGETPSNLQQIEKNIVARKGSFKQAQKAIVGLIDTGISFNQKLDKYAQAAVMGEMMLGIPIRESIYNFEQLSKRPTQYSMQLNERMNYLTAVTYDQIRRFEDNWNTNAAAELAMDTYAEKLDPQKSGE